DRTACETRTLVSADENALLWKFLRWSETSLRDPLGSPVLPSALLDVKVAEVDGDQEQVADGFRPGAPRIRSAFGRKPKSVGLADVVHVLRDRTPAADLQPIVMTPQEMVRPEIELLVGAVAR